MAAHQGRLEASTHCVPEGRSSPPWNQPVQPALGEAAVNLGTSLNLWYLADFLIPRPEFLHLMSNTDGAGGSVHV